MEFNFEVASNIETLKPYKPGKPISEVQREYGITKVIKLASNENPLGVSPMALQAIKNRMEQLHRYPDPSCYELIQLISQIWKVSKSKIAIGNGSNEIIDLLIRIGCRSGDAILTSQSAFVAYQVCAQAAGVETIFAPLLTGYKVDLEKMAEILLKDQRIKIVFLPNPNNPTGTYISSPLVENFLQKISQRKNLLVVFDEAYTEFVRANDYSPAIDYLSQYPQVISIRTLSKAYGLAGLRVGVLLAHEKVIDWFNRVRNPFNVNELAQVAAIAGLQDAEFVKRTQKTTWQGLDYFYDEFKKRQLSYVESQANFVMFDTARDAVKVNEELLKRGVIFRPIVNYGFKTHLRVSVGLPEENEMAIKQLDNVFAEIPPIKTI